MEKIGTDYKRRDLKNVDYTNGGALTQLDPFNS